jgi:hypothetical protein
VAWELRAAVKARMCGADGPYAPKLVLALALSTTTTIFPYARLPLR